jgi:outer membrane protein TolC
MKFRMVRLAFAAISIGTLVISGQGQTTNTLRPGRGLTLEQAINEVLVQNESLQAKMLEVEIARRQYKAERGIFEPAVVGSFEHIDNSRENTIEQQAALGLFATRDYNERNDLYNGGLEFLSPVGSKFRVGYNLRRLQNTLNARLGSGEYVTTVGITVTQPLLKNAGVAATMARIRLGAINSDIAYQDYRRQLMLTLSRAEAAYWDLYFSQEQERISEESVRLAESVYRDNKARLEVGKSSELELLQAEAGAALRRSRRSDAAQRLNEAATQLSTLFSGSTGEAAPMIWAVEEPQVRLVATNFYDAYREAFEKNPDYLTRKHQAVAENVRLAFAKNQRLPELDLKGSYGLNGLGRVPGESHDDLERADYPAWSVGVEFRIPVTGGIRERNEYKAAQLAKERSLVNLKEIEVQVGNALNTSLLKVNNLRESVENHRSVIEFHEKLLQTQLARLEVGVIDSRTVLETEEKLFEARITLLENLVAYQKALLELDLIKGTTLASWNVEMTKADLQRNTDRLLSSNRLKGPAFDALRQDVQKEYKEKLKNLNAAERPQTIMEKVFE